MTPYLGYIDIDIDIGIGIDIGNVIDIDIDIGIGIDIGNGIDIDIDIGTGVGIDIGLLQMLMLTFDDDSELPIDYDTSLLPQVFPTWKLEYRN